jgi:hypothetical protein
VTHWKPFRLRGRDELADAIRIGHPICRHGDPVLAEVLSVDAAGALNLARQVRGRKMGAPVGPSRNALTDCDAVPTRCTPGREGEGS